MLFLLTDLWRKKDLFFFFFEIIDISLSNCVHLDKSRQFITWMVLFWSISYTPEVILLILKLSLSVTSCVALRSICWQNLYTVLRCWNTAGTRMFLSFNIFSFKYFFSFLVHMLGDLVKLHILNWSLADLCAGSSVQKYFDVSTIQDWNFKS